MQVEKDIAIVNKDLCDRLIELNGIIWKILKAFNFEKRKDKLNKRYRHKKRRNPNDKILKNVCKILKKRPDVVRLGEVTSELRETLMWERNERLLDMQRNLKLLAKNGSKTVFLTEENIDDLYANITKDIVSLESWRVSMNRSLKAISRYSRGW